MTMKLAAGSLLIILLCEAAYSVKVVIIGAGPAGLAAASTLVQGGVADSDVTILEAQDRVGGRIYTMPYGSNLLEMGAQWVHGETGNAVFDLAAPAGELNLTYSEEMMGDASDVAFLLENGIPIDISKKDAFLDWMERIGDLPDSAFTGFTGSLGQFITQKYNKDVVSGTLRVLGTKLGSSFMDWFHRFENIEDGSDSWFNVSTQSFMEFTEYGGNQDIFWKRGYSTLFKLLMKGIPSKNASQPLPLSHRIFLNKPVTLIDYSTKPIKIKTADNTVYTADHVIVTVSLGHLKDKAATLFKPALSSRKRTAIQGLGFGTVDKIYLEFPQRWWKATNGGVSFIFNNNSDALVASDWTRGILGFYTVHNQPNMMVGWLTGAAAKKAESLSDTEVLKASSAAIKRHIGNAYRYVEPTKVVRSKWFTNPYFKGSYSFRSMDSQKLDTWASDLAAPVKDSSGVHRVLFAGEATHSTRFSTVDGAVQTGRREANRILALL